MKFDFSYDAYLHLKFEFDDDDYVNYFKCFVDYGSQIFPEDKAKYWNERKYVLLHDFITVYVQSECSKFIEETGELGRKIFVTVNDRGMISKFRTYQGRHSQDISVCQQFYSCKMKESIACCIKCKHGKHDYCDKSCMITIVLCEKCGHFTEDLNECCR